MECKDFEPSIIQDNQDNIYIDISKAFSFLLVERVDASIALNSFVPIKDIAETKGLTSTRSIRFELNKAESKYTYKNQVFVTDIPFNNKERSFYPEEIKEFKKVYSYIANM